MTVLDQDAAARAARRTHWVFIALFCAPGVAFAIWYLTAQAVDLKAGHYGCRPENPLVVGHFWKATVEDGQVVNMKWNGFSHVRVREFSLGAQHGADEFTANVDGTAATCKYRG
ncbi:hypothetical protein ACT8ZV_12145 [Nocardioides sp. MAHUQ-72]|uniref:hypothetical protein n=1 Tax=unclassified Nocardioides TaxID=2615069 RepID=UPI003614E67C